MKRFIAPSILSANFGNLAKDIEMINNSDADWIHVDVMDGVFVPNISFGFPIIKYVKKLAKKPLDVHLMVVQPEKYITRFKEVGADILTVHLEASPHLHRTIQAIKSQNMKAGVVLNPHSNVSLLEDILPDLDLVLLMSVNPGYGGQSFIENTYDKLEQLAKLKAKRNPNLLIEIDGGVDLSNASTLFNKGANVLVAGNTVFSSDDPANTIQLLKSK